MENPNNTGAFIMDLKAPYSILKVDDSFFQMMAYEAADLNDKISQLSKLVHPEDYKELLASITYQLARSNYTSDKVRLIRSDGKLYQILMNGQIFTLKDGRDVLKCTCTNITPLDTPIGTVTQDSADFEAFSNTVRSGFSKHICDNSLTIVWANDYFYNSLGYTKAEYTKAMGTSFIPVVYEDDLPIVVNSITNLIEGQKIDITFRVNLKNKSMRWMNLVASCTDEMKDELPIANFVLNDVTKLKYAQIKAELETKKYDIFSDLSSEIPFEYEIDTDTITYAKKYEDIFGRKCVWRHPVRKFIDSGFISPDTEDNFKAIFSAAKKGEEFHSAEYKLKNRQGKYEWYYSAYSLIEDENGEPFRAIGLLRNIHTQKKEQASFAKRAQTDPLTGLLNKATTESFVKEHLKEIQSGAYDVLMLVDIDDFTKINEIYGHLIGDEVISDIAHALMRFTVNDGFVGRVGGDEFLIYLPNILDTSFACEKAEKYAKELQLKYPGDNDKPKVTMSIGITATDVPIPYSDLIEQAEVAVYQAKKNGKNSFVLYDESFEHMGMHNSRKKQVCNYNSVVICNALNILMENTDTLSCIQQAVNYVGNAMGIDRIAIWEYQDDRNFLDKTFEWQSSSYPYADAATENLKSLQWEEVDTLTLNGTYHTANTKSVRLSNFGKGSFAGVKEFMQSKFSYEGSSIGYIGYFNYSSDEVWTTEAIETYHMFTNALNGYMQRKFLENH